MWVWDLSTKVGWCIQVSSSASCTSSVTMTSRSSWSMAPWPHVVRLCFMGAMAVLANHWIVAGILSIL